MKTIQTPPFIIDRQFLFKSSEVRVNKELIHKPMPKPIIRLLIISAENILTVNVPKIAPAMLIKLPTKNAILLHFVSETIPDNRELIVEPNKTLPPSNPFSKMINLTLMPEQVLSNMFL
jgi:hypothetical protein